MTYNNERENITRKYSYSYIAIDRSKSTHGSGDNCRTENLGSQRILPVYIPASFYQTVVKARKIADREGRSLSDLIRDLLRDYVRVHEPGNPQLPLTRFTGEQKPEEPPRWLTCRYSRKTLRKGEFYCERFAFWRLPKACERCRRYTPE